MGNPRKPDAIKKLEGTFRKDRSEPDQPQVEAVRIPAPPKHLAEDEKQFWNKYRRVLQPLSVVAATDLDALEMLSVARANFERLRIAEERDQKQFLSASKEVRSWQTVLGLTPQSRSTIKQLVGPEVADDLDEFLRPPEGEIVN